MRDARGDILDQSGRELLAICIIGGADIGGDRKARGHRQADRGHFGEVRPLAAQQFLRAFGGGRVAAEQMHHLRHHKLLLPRGGGCGGNRVAALRGRLSFAFSGIRLTCLHDGPANGRKSPPPPRRRRSKPARRGERRATRPRPTASCAARSPRRSEEHTSELQSLMRTSYAVFCLKKKSNYNSITSHTIKIT